VASRNNGSTLASAFGDPLRIPRVNDIGIVYVEDAWDTGVKTRMIERVASLLKQNNRRLFQSYDSLTLFKV
jgi:hypothetical protein